MKKCPQCGRNYSDLIMQCPACETDLIKIQNTQSDQDTEKFSSQQLLEERQQIEAMQQRLKSDGTVVAVGENTEGQCDVSNWSNIKLPSAIR